MSYSYSLRPCRECGGERKPGDVVRGGGVRCWSCRLKAVLGRGRGNERAGGSVTTGANARDLAREQRMCQLYTTGHTLQQIATVYGISRERVRQIISRAGVTRAEGGLAKSSQQKAEAKAAARKKRLDEKAQAMFGCTFDDLLFWNDDRRGWASGTKSRAYLNQRKAAEWRGIGWELTFPQWCQIWLESGHWAERGRKADAYCMARKQDFGPYAVWNVYITTLSQNVVDYQAELKRRGVMCADGYKRLPERALQVEAAA